MIEDKTLHQMRLLDAETIELIATLQKRPTKLTPARRNEFVRQANRTVALLNKALPLLGIE